MKNEMSSGIIRHVDDLGRVVIPKELRKQLGIDAEDAVEIGICGRTVHIRKHQPLRTLESLCKSYLDSFWKSCRTICVVCGTEQVIATRGVEFVTDILLSEEVRWYIQQRTEYQYAEEHPMSLFEKSKYVVDSLYPIEAEGTPLGAVVLIHFRNATPVERGCARYMADILSELAKRKEV